MIDELTAAPRLVTQRPATYLAVDGAGAPGSPAHLDAIGVLMQAAASAGARSPLEGQWWVDDDRPPLEVPRDEWRWRLLVDVTGLSVAEPTAPVHVVTIDEGRCIEAVHVGDYADEPRTLTAMDGFMAEHGLVMAGRHHEIYVDDETVPPERRRTVLRHPVRKADDRQEG